MYVSKEWVIKNALNSASAVLHRPCSVKDIQLGLFAHCKKCNSFWKCAQFLKKSPCFCWIVTQHLPEPQGCILTVGHQLCSRTLLHPQPSS